MPKNQPKKGTTMPATSRSTVKRVTTKRVTKTKKLPSSWWQTNKLKALVFITLFAGIGSYMIFKSFAATPNQAAAAQFAPDQFLLSFRVGVPDNAQQALLNRYGLSVRSDIPQLQTKVVKVNPKALDAVVAALSHNPAVEFAERDGVVTPTDVTPNDPCYAYPNSTQGCFGGSVGFTPMQVPKAWDTTTGSASVVIAILDTGIAPHPDLIANLLPGHNVLDNSSDTSDTNGHGTEVAGAAAAVGNNNQGAVGYCFTCKLLPVKIAISGGAYTSDIASGITWASDHGAKVINISYAGTTGSSTFDNAVNYARQHGLLVAAGAGNSGNSILAYPAATKGVIGVAATDINNNLVGYSNYGSWVKIAGTYQPIVPVLKDPYTGTQWSYAPVGGTSLTTPEIAGIIGLLFSAKPTATNTEVEQALLNNTTPCCNGQIGGGLANAYKAMQVLTGATLPPADTTAPTLNITYPISGATVSGSVVATADANDEVGVAKVEFYLDGQFFISDSTVPYGWYVTTNSFSNGSHVLTAKAYDTSYNVTSASVTFTINNATADATAPATSISSPTSSATVAGNTTVSATATDNTGVTSTELYIDGVLRASNTSGSLSFAWDTTQEVNGSHTLQTKAYDAAGNIGTSATVTVTVNNQSDTVAPVVTITNPASGSFVLTQQTISATATDNIAVTKMELVVDGKLKATSSTGSISYLWNTKSLKKGSHTITVKAYDAAGNVGQSSVVVYK